MKLSKNKIKYYIISLIFILLITLLGKINITLSNTKYENNLPKSVTQEKIINTEIDPSKFIEAYVKRVVDGDTVLVTIDNKDYKLRLIGVNSPESTTKIQKYGKEASNYTKNYLTNKTIYLEKDVSETDKYGRLLRYIWLEIPKEISSDEISTKMFNAILIINGYAQVATYPPDIKYVDYFTNFQYNARNKKIGLWGL